RSAHCDTSLRRYLRLLSICSYNDFSGEMPAYPRSLHSFPTRRSSDLATLTGWQTVIMKQGPSGLVYSLYGSDQAQHAAGFVRIGDRKSTRLNSSHVAISYAVFCLKKKNNSQNRTGSA